MIKTKTAVFLISMLIALEGCFDVSAFQKKSEDHLRQRVNEQWEAKVAGDWGKVYDMFVSSFRETIKRDRYVKTANMYFTGFTVNKVEILPSKNEAIAHIDYSVSQMGFTFDMENKQNWVWENDDWYLKVEPKKSVYPFNDVPKAKNSTASPTKK